MSGAGTAGTLLGLRNVTNIETVTWTSASPTALELLRRVADAQQRIAGALYQPADVIVMHPRRWAWLLTQADAQSRPLVVPSTSGPSNALGSLTGGGAEGRVGELAGLGVYLDGNIPTNINTNQDLILVVATRENLLFESTLRTRVLQETLSGNLTCRLQLWNYVALATRQPKSIAVISGSALAPPTF